MNGKRVLVALPAYNAAKTLELTVADLPSGVVDSYHFVDDSSADSTGP